MKTTGSWVRSDACGQRRAAALFICFALACGLSPIVAQADSRPLNIIAAEPQSGLDPNIAVTQASLRVAELIYDTLIDYDAKDGLAPALAKSWSLSPDGLSYTFKLQENARFSDGSPITADDVVFSLQRAAKGAALGPQLSIVSAIAAVDPATVKVTLSKPSRVFLNTLASVGSAGILSKKAVEADSNYFSKPTATSGPWRLTEWILKDHITLAANDGYWSAGNPKIKQINYTFNIDATAAAADLQAGTADMTYPMDPTNALRLSASGEIKMYLEPSPGVIGFGYGDKSKPPFNDVRVRQAFAYAAPRADKQKTCWKDMGPVAYGNLVFDGSWAYTPGLTRYDLPRDKALSTAGELLDQAGWKMGAGGVRTAHGVQGVDDGSLLAVTVQYENSWPQAQCHTLFLQTDLAPLGVKITPQAFDGATFWGDVAKNKFAMYHLGDNWATVDDEMQQGFTCKGQATNLIAKWCDPHVDELVTAAAAEPDLKKAAADYAEVQKIYAEQQPALINGAQYSLVGATPKLEGFYPRADASNRALISSTLAP
jgi:peptide/nickel transport system substrate-binding protein